jgi:cysteine sulfinate desulfinase/cysteine desulfurase-like protein
MELSPTLLAIGCDLTLIRGAVRLSVGSHNTASEIDEAARRIIATIKHLRQVNYRSAGFEATRRRARKTLQ